MVDGSHRRRAQRRLVRSPGPRLPAVHLLQPDDVGVERGDGLSQSVVVDAAVGTEAVLDVERGDAHVHDPGPGKRGALPGRTGSARKASIASRVGNTVSPGPEVRPTSVTAVSRTATFAALYACGMCGGSTLGLA